MQRDFSNPGVIHAVCARQCPAGFLLPLTFNPRRKMILEAGQAPHSIKTLGTSREDPDTHITILYL